MKPSQDKRTKLAKKLMDSIKTKPYTQAKLTRVETALIIQTFMHFEAEEDIN